MNFFFSSLLATTLTLGSLIIWCAGIVLAVGGWQTFWAFCPLYALYIVVERAMAFYHILGYALR